MRILFCASNSISSQAIQRVTWSQWSHVAIIDGDDVIEAVWPKVRRTSLDEVIRKHSRFVVVEIPCADEAAAIRWAAERIGKQYDLFGMLGLGINHDWQNDDKWWCSELVTGAVLAGGTKLFRDGLLHRITPQHLWMLNYPVIIGG